MKVAPTRAAVESAAERVLMLAQFNALAGFAGNGKRWPLGSRFEPDDAQIVAELVQLDDPKQVDYLIRLAEEVGAIRVTSVGFVRSISALTAWFEQSATDRAKSIVEAMFELPPLMVLPGDPDALRADAVAEANAAAIAAEFDSDNEDQDRYDFGYEEPYQPDPQQRLYELLDDRMPHWLVAAYTGRRPLEVSAIVERITAMVLDAFTQLGMLPGERRWVPAAIAVDVPLLLEWWARAGLFDLIDSVDGSHLAGRSVSLTAFGRHLLPSWLDAVGYSAPTIGEIDEIPVEELLEVSAAVDGGEVEELLARWRPEWEPSSKARVLVAAMNAAPRATSRLAAMRLLGVLGRLDADGVEPEIRRLLGGQ